MSATTWEMVVGLEVHVQLKTATKAFCACSAEFGSSPNSNTCPCCLGLPGALPVLNDQAVELAIRAALATGGDIQEVSVFSRKNYFYPDLPKGYQISQFDKPLALGGGLDIQVGDANKRIRITRIHMEEDAGKSVHDRFANATAIDLNRAGVPLCEIVSEPDMRSSAEAGAYLRALKQALEYAGVSDCSMELGSLRVDANVSARPMGSDELRTRTEIKNVNSFSNVERALELEFARHVETYEAGGTIVQQTMLFDADKQEVRAARSKEGSHDYRYFPEPDLPPLVVPSTRVDHIRATMPATHAEMMRLFQEKFGASPAQARVVTSNPQFAAWAEDGAKASTAPEAVVTFASGSILKHLNESGADPAKVSQFLPSSSLAAVASMTKAGAISSTAAQKVLSMLWGNPDLVPEQVVEAEGLAQVSDDSALVGWINEVFAEMPAEAARFTGGERKLQGVLIGAIMKKSKGSADPKKLAQLLGARVTG